MRVPARAAVPTALLAATLVLPPVVPGPGATVAAGAGSVTTASGHRGSDAVVERRKLGESVRGRPIMAYRLGERTGPVVVLFSTMHGNEPRPRQILLSLRDRRPVRGVDLWVVPTYNPDGLAAGTRRNAHGVDLNRNFPYRWADLDGSYESGPRPRSEPETRAVIRFLRDVRPRRILSFHQPLHGVDQDTKNRRFARRVARTLQLPRKTFDCGGVCHGTMTGWYNDRFRGSALTVEYGPDPGRRLMRRTAPRRVLDLFGAHRVRVRR
ncbi:MAG TPA: M14 family zinc carboxypeptidase [Nocardioides sp.]|nr:M14 family zinc carboxypeptidase [Nocardioides sp.]